MNKLLYFFMIILLSGCSGETTPEEQNEEVERLRKQAAEMQERVDEMRPTLDAQSQRTIDRVERRIESQESP